MKQSSGPAWVGSELHTCAKSIQEVKQQIGNPWKMTGKQENQREETRAVPGGRFHSTNVKKQTRRFRKYSL